MALFPRFGTDLSAKVAKPATAGLTSRDHAANFRNCRNFRGPGGLEFQQPAGLDDHLAARVADLADAYHERIAIVLEAGDIGDAEACRIAEAEIGRRFVEVFMPGEAAAGEGLLIAPVGKRHSRCCHDPLCIGTSFRTPYTRATLHERTQ